MSLNTKKLRLYGKKYREEHKEKLGIERKKYRLSCKEHFRKKDKEYRKTRTVIIKNYATEYYKRNKLVINERNRQRDKEMRLKVIAHYSNGLMCCACCNENTFQFLTIDHINNDGAEHRKTLKNKIYWWLKINGYPEDFQVLCMNCNFAKGMYGKCPHQKEKIQIVR